MGKYESYLGMAVSFLLIVMFAVILRGCEVKETSFQACVTNNHSPLECAAAEKIRN